MSFNPAAFVADIEQAAWTGNWTLRYLSPTASGKRPWLHRAGSAPDAPRLYLSAGIHGDEISGPLAMLEMLRRSDFFRDFNVTIFPILNPNGMKAGLRLNSDGIDLNRDYRNSKSDEILSHIETLMTLAPFDAAMYLHEDYEGTGAYLYELNEALPDTLGAEIIAAMSRHVPIDLRPIIEEVTARGGVISRKDIILKHGSLEDRPDWPEALYLGVKHTKVGYTTETPMLAPLEARVAAQIAAVSTLMEALKNNRPSS